MPKLDITKNFIRVRQVDPNEFDRTTFKTIRLTSGVKAVIGNLKGQKTTTTQTILFDKKKFNAIKVRQWLKKNVTKFSDAMKLEGDKVSLFSNHEEEFLDVNALFVKHIDGHFPKLTQEGIMKIFETCGITSEDTIEEDMFNESFAEEEVEEKKNVTVQELKDRIAEIDVILNKNKKSDNNEKA